MISVSRSTFAVVNGQVAQKSSRPRLCRFTVRVMSPAILSCLTTSQRRFRVCFVYYAFVSLVSSQYHLKLPATKLSISDHLLTISGDITLNEITDDFSFGRLVTDLGTAFN